MHVLVTADTVGGVWTYARELVSGLVRRGVRVTLVSFGEIPTSEQCEWMEGLPEVDYRPTAFQLEWMHDCEEDLLASSEYLSGIIEEVQPDLLHLSQYAYGALPVDIPKLVVAHSDVIGWWEAVHGEMPCDSEWIRNYRDVVTRGIAEASAVVAPTAWMLEQLIQYYGLPQQAAVIYNGRNPGLFQPHSAKEDMAVSVGRLWDPGKQIALLLESQHRLPILIAGAERSPETAVRSSVTVKSSTAVEWCGPQPPSKIAQLLSRASIYAGTSRYEPFGLAPLEAAFSRCALVLNDIPSLREVWGDAALYFTTNDAGSLADAIEQLRRDPRLRLSYANLAYQHARQRYTAEYMVDSYLELYARLLSRSWQAEVAGRSAA